MWKSEGAQGNVYGEAPLLHSQDRPYWRPGLEPNCKSREFLIRLSLTARQFFYTVRERVRPFQGVYSFPGGSEGKESACNAGDLSSIPGSGRSLREGNGNPFQNSCLENSMDRGAWWATSMGSQRVRHNWATDFHFHFFKASKSRDSHSRTLNSQTPQNPVGPRKKPNSPC